MPPDRHFDVTREVDLIEEVGRIHGLDENLPSTLPAVGQRGGLSREQRLRRRAEDTMRDLGFDEVVGWSFTDPGEPGGCGSRRTTAARNGIVALQPALRGPVGDADDAARLAARRRPRQPRPRRRARRPLRVRPRLPADGDAAPSGRLRRRAAGAVPRAAPDRLPRGRAAGARRPGGAAASRPTSSRSRACSRRSPPQLGAPLSFEAGGEPFLHPGPRGRVSVAGDAPPAGSASSTRWSAAPGTSRRRPASKSTSRRSSPPPRPARRSTRT